MSISRLASAAAVAAMLVSPALVSASDSEKTKAAKPASTVSSKTVPASPMATLKGVKAVPMSSSELANVKGLHVHFIEPGHGFAKFHLAGNPENKGVGTGNWYDNGSPDGELVAPSYHGLCKAGPIGIPVMPGHLSQCP